MKNNKRYLAVALSLGMVLSALPAAQAEEQSSFADVSGNHWASVYISSMKRMGVVTGYNGSLFAPEANVTRAEYVKMLLELGYKNNLLHVINYIKAPTAPYTDVTKDDWYHSYIVDAYNRGLIDAAATFRPGDAITREDMAVITANFVKLILPEVLVPNTQMPAIPFADYQDIKSEHLNDILLLKKYGVINGKLNTSNQSVFLPKESLTRAEAAAVLFKFLDAKQTGMMPTVTTFKEGEVTFSVQKNQYEMIIKASIDKKPAEGYSVKIDRVAVAGDSVKVYYTCGKSAAGSQDTGKTTDTYTLKAQSGVKYMYSFIADKAGDNVTLTENGITFTITHEADNLRVVADMGEKPTSGYDVKIQRIDFGPNNTILISYMYRTPQPGEFTAQVITHPKAEINERVEISTSYQYKLVKVDYK